MKFFGSEEREGMDLLSDGRGRSRTAEEGSRRKDPEGRGVKDYGKLEQPGRGREI